MRLVQVVDHAHGDVEAHVLGGPVLLGRGRRPPAATRTARVVRVHRDARARSAPATGGSEPLGRVAVHEQRLDARCRRSGAATFALTHDVDAPSLRGRDSSSKTCTTPAPVSITGTVDSVTTVSMSVGAPARDRARRRCPRACISSRGARRGRTRRSVWTASAGSPAVGERAAQDLDEHARWCRSPPCRRAARRRCRS